MNADKTEATRLADAPERIWLQVCDDADCVESFASHDGVTWCQDKVHDTDIEYVRADRAAPPAESERIAALEADRDSWAEQASQRVKDCERFIERIAALEAALAERDKVIEQARVALEEMQYARTDKAERLTADALRAIEEVQHD